jgi:hypothetical protein
MAYLGLLAWIAAQLFGCFVLLDAEHIDWKKEGDKWIYIAAGVDR